MEGKDRLKELEELKYGMVIVDNDHIGQTMEEGINSSPTVDTNDLLNREEFQSGVSLPLAAKYADRFNTLASYANYANGVLKGVVRSAITLFGAVTRPERLGLTEKQVKDNPIKAAHRRDILELSEVAYAIYVNSYRGAEGNSRAKQNFAIDRANNFLYSETKNLGLFAGGKPDTDDDFAKFSQSLASLSYAFGKNTSGYESGQLGYVPSRDYGIGPIVTPIDRGIDIGNFTGSFLTRAGDKSLLYKAGITLLSDLVGTNAKYQRSALLENSYDPNSSILGSLGVLADAAGYGLMFGEMALVTSMTWGTATPAAVAAQAGARLGTAGMVGYTVLNGGFNDYLDSVALSRKYFKGNTLQRAYTGSFFISRALEAATASVSYAYGANVSEKIIDTVFSQNAIWSTWLATAGRNAGTLIADSVIDTAFDFTVYGMVRSIDNGDGTILTAQDYRMFDTKNIGNVLFQRAMMRVANSGLRARKVALTGMETGWGRVQFFKDTYGNDSWIGKRDNVAAKMARFSWRLMDAISPNHYKEMDILYQKEGGIVNVIRNNPDTFRLFEYANLYNHYEYNSNNVYKLFHKKDKKLFLANYMMGKDVDDISYIKMREQKLINVSLLNNDGSVDHDSASGIGKIMADEAVKIDSEDISKDEKYKKWEVFKRNIFNTFVATVDIDNPKTKQKVRKVKFADSEAFTDPQRRQISADIINEIRAVRLNDTKFSSSIQESIKSTLEVISSKTQRDQIAYGHNKFVDTISANMKNKKINGEIIYRDNNQTAYNVREFAELERGVQDRNNEFIEYLGTFDKIDGEDTANMTLSEIAQATILPNKITSINAITFDIVNKIMSHEDMPVTKYSRSSEVAAKQIKKYSRSSPEVEHEINKPGGLMDQHKKKMDILLKEMDKLGYSPDEMRAYLKIKRPEMNNAYDISVERIINKLNADEVAKQKAEDAKNYKPWDMIANRIIDKSNTAAIANKKASDEQYIRDISPERIRDVVFDKENGTLSDYLNTIVRAITKYELNIEGKGSGKIKAGVPYSEDMLSANIIDSLTKYHAAITILGDRVDGSILNEHKAALEKMMTKQSKYMSYERLKNSPIGKMFDAVFGADKSDFNVKFSSMVFTPAYANMVNRGKMMSLFLNEYNFRSKEDAVDILMEANPTLTKLDLELVSMISKIGFEQLGMETSYEVIVNGKSITIDSDFDPNARYNFKIKSDSSFDEKLFVLSLMKLHLIDEADGTNILSEVLQQQGLDGVTVTKPKPGIEGFEINYRDVDDDMALNVYGRAYNEATGTKSYDEESNIVIGTSGSSPYFQLGGGDKFKVGTFKSLLSQFAVVGDNVTGLGQVAYSMINMVGRHSARKGIGEILSRLNEQVWAELGAGGGQDKFVTAVHQHFELWNSSRLALSATRYMKDKYGIDVDITAISRSETRMGSSIQIWAINDPTFQDKSGKVNNVSKTQWENFKKKNNLIVIGEAGTGQAEIYVRVPAGTPEQQKQELARAFFGMQANGKGLNEGMETFKEWQLTHKHKVADSEMDKFIAGTMSHKEMLNTYISYIKDRFAFGEKKRDLVKDEEYDSQVVADFIEKKTEQTAGDLIAVFESLRTLQKEDASLLDAFKEKVKTEIFESESPFVIAYRKYMMTETDPTTSKEATDVLNRFQDLVRKGEELLKRIQGLDTEKEFAVEISKLKGWINTTVISAKNTSEDFYNMILHKQAHSIFGYETEGELNTFIKGLSNDSKYDDRAKQLLYRTVISGIESSFYGLDYAKRFGIMNSFNSIFTKTDGNLKDAIGNHMASLTNKKGRLMILPPGVGPTGEVYGSGMQGLPTWIIKAIREYVPSSDMAQKIALNLYGWLHKGIYVPNSQFNDLSQGKTKLNIGENDIILMADDTKNIPPELVKWLRDNTSEADKKRGILAVDYDLDTESGKNILTNLMKGFTLQTELTSTPNEKGIGALISNVIPSSYKNVNDMIDTEFKTGALYQRIKTDLYDTFMFGDIDRFNNSVSKAFRRGTEVPGIVAQAVISNKALGADDIILGTIKNDTMDILIEKQKINVSADDIDIMVKTNSAIWSTHQMLAAYQQTIGSLPKSHNIDRTLLREAGEAFARLLAMEDSMSVPIGSNWKADANKLLEVISNKDYGVFAKVEGLDGKAVYLTKFGRNPSQINFQDLTSIVAGIRPPGGHTGIEITNGLMYRLLKGDFDGDLLIGTRLTSNSLKEISTNYTTGEKIDPMKALISGWVIGERNTSFVEGHKLGGDKAYSDYRYKEGERSFVGNMYAATERFLALASVYDGSPIQMADLAATKEYTELIKDLEKYETSIIDDRMEKSSLLRLLTNNKMSMNSDRFVLYSSTAEKIWGNVHGSFRVTNMSIENNGIKLFAYDNQGAGISGSKGVIIGRQDLSSGGFKVLAVLKSDKMTFASMNRLAQGIVASKDKLYNSEIDNDYDLILRVIADLNLSDRVEIEPENAFKNKSVMSIGALPVIAIDAGVNNAAEKGSTRVSTELLSKFGGDIQKLGSAFHDFALKVFVGTAFPILHKNSKEGLRGSIFDIKDVSVKMRDSIMRGLINSNPRFINGLAKHYKENGFKHGFNEDVIRTLFAFSSKNIPDISTLEKGSSIYKRLTNVPWNNLKHRIHPKLYAAHKIIGEMFRDPETAKGLSALTSIVDLKSDTPMTKIIMDHVAKKELPFFSPIEIDGEIVNLEKTAFFLARMKERIANVYSLGSESFGLKMFTERLDTRPVVINSPPIGETGEIDIARYIRDVKNNSNRTQPMMITDLDIRNLFNDLKISIEQVTLQNAESLSVKSMMDLNFKYTTGDLTGEDIDGYTKIVNKDVIIIKQNGKKISANHLYLTFAKYLENDKTSQSEYNIAKAALQGIYLSLDSDTKILLSLRNEGLSHSISSKLVDNMDAHDNKVTGEVLVDIAKDMRSLTHGLIEINNTPMDLQNKMNIDKQYPISGC